MLKISMSVSTIPIFFSITANNLLKYFENQIFFPLNFEKKNHRNNVKFFEKSNEKIFYFPRIREIFNRCRKKWTNFHFFTKLVKLHSISNFRFLNQYPNTLSFSRLPQDYPRQTKLILKNLDYILLIQELTATLQWFNFKLIQFVFFSSLFCKVDNMNIIEFEKRLKYFPYFLILSVLVVVLAQRHIQNTRRMI